MRWMRYYLGGCKILPWKYGWGEGEGTEHDFEGSMNISTLTILTGAG